MNNAHVYKSHISENKCVRIPDGSFSKEAEKPNTLSVEQDQSQADITITENQVSAIETELKPSEQELASEPVSENQAEAQSNVDESATDSVANNLQTPAPEISREALAALYQKELDNLAQSVAENAYFDAITQKKQELKDCISSVQQTLDELIQKHERFMEQYTSELKYMAVEIAEKMIADKIDTDDTVLQRLVLQNIKNVKTAEWINVELSEQLVGLVDNIKRELESSEYNGRANVFTVAGKNDICRITTENGTIVSTISVQADNLRKVFLEADKAMH